MASRRRNIVGLCCLAVLPVVIAVAVRIWGPGDFIFVPGGITDSGVIIAWAGLANELPLLPLAIAVVAGDAIAGEANIGSLRYLLTVPADRTRLLTVKYVSIVIAALVATLAVAAAGLVSGLILFGAGPMTLLSGNEIDLAAALWRLLLACGWLAAGMAALGALGLFVSTLTEQPISVVVTVMLINGAMLLLNSIGQLEWLHPWLLTPSWWSFVDLMREPIFPDRLIHGLLTACAYAIVFLLAAWAQFRDKDITT